MSFCVFVVVIVSLFHIFLLHLYRSVTTLIVFLEFQRLQILVPFFVIERIDYILEEVLVFPHFGMARVCK